MTAHPQDIEETIELEQHAHEVRLQLLRDPAFVTGLESGIEDERAGRLMSLGDFKRELGVS